MCQLAELILCLSGAVLAAPSELLPNPGFEADAVEKSLPDGWTVLEGRVGLTTKNVRSGKRALECHDAGANASVSVDSAHLPCNTSCCYTARAWLRPEGPARPSLYLQFFDDAGQRIGVCAKFAPASADWISVSLGAAPPKAARTVSVLVFSGAAEEGTFQVDDLSLKRIPKEGPAVVDIGTQRQLFLDDYMVEEMESIERVFHPARKDPEPVIVADQPWEQRSFLGVIGNCIFHDEADQLYKMFYVIYQVIGQGGERQHYAVATSQDGLRWEKPKLGVADYKGAKDNNLLWDYESPRYAKEFWAYNNILRDARDPDPARRYKVLGMWARYGERGNYAGYGMLVAFSPDGIHWTEPQENPVLPNGDTHTLLGWDDRIGKYVAYPRTSSSTSARNIGYSTSDDFLHWTPTQTVLEPGPGDPPHYEIYGMPVVKYEGLYVGVPWAFVAADLEPLDTQLVVSRDGIRWQKVAGGQMLIPRGSAGSFDDGYAVSANPLVVGDEILFYYMACGFPHGPRIFQETKWEGSIGRARLRLDGFVSLASLADSGGTIVTRPLRFTGRHMIVNCNCARGWLRVELQDSEGATIAGFAEGDCDPIRTDAIGQHVTWNGREDVSSLSGKPVRVRLRLGDGEIYSFGFVD